MINMNYNAALKMVVRDNTLKRIARKIAQSIVSEEKPYLISEATVEFQLTQEEVIKVLQHLSRLK